MNPCINIVITLLYLIFSTNIRAQNIMGIDSTEGYVVSLMEYSGHPDSILFNQFRCILLSDTLGLSELIHKDLSDQSIQLLNSRNSYFADSIINKNTIGNILIEKGYPFLHIWMHFLLDSSSIDGSFMRNIFTDDIYRNLSTSTFPDDIIGGIIMNTLHPDNITNFCPFSSKGLYYTITKVKIKFIIFNEGSISLLYDTWLSNSILGTKDKRIMKICTNSQFPIYTKVFLQKNLNGKLQVLLPIETEVIW